MKLSIRRPKTETDYYTFLGRDAIEAVKVYIQQLRMRGMDLEMSDPLFLKDKLKVKERVTPKTLQDLMRDLSRRSGLVNKRNNGRHFNPLGTHALRESFSTILSNLTSRIYSKNDIDFLLGHVVGELDKVYQGQDFNR